VEWLKVKALSSSPSAAKKKKKKKNLYSSIKPGNFLPFYLSLTTREVNLSVKTYSFRDMVLDLEN
jgi:hypothetical protein